MSLDGGYYGSVDHAIANLQRGRRQGRNEGLKLGRQEGYQQGYDEGHAAGWEAGIACANEEILKQMEFTRQQLAEKEILQAQIEQQLEIIKQLEAKVTELEQKSQAVETPAAKLYRLIDTLKQANAQLQTKVSNLEHELHTTSKAYADQLWQHNKSMVFMNSVRGVLEDLTHEDSIQANHVRELFAKKYVDQVNASLEKGLIRLAPDQDDEFAKSLPRTRQFIIDLLSNNSITPSPIMLSASH